MEVVEDKHMRSIIRKIQSYLLLFIVTACFILGNMIWIKPVVTDAQTHKLTMDQAVSLAMNNSGEYRKTKSKITLQNVKYTQAVKSIQLKKKNMSTFRWSPLLNFKFPESPTLADESEWIFKPIQIQAEISKLEHQLTDIRYSVKETISNIYVQAYTAQEKIKYYQENVDNLQKSLAQNKARLYAGEAKQSDITLIEKTITSSQTALGNASRQYETAKKKITDLIDLDVTSGYEFTNPYLENTLSRDSLQDIVNYTLENSQTFYEAKMETRLALTSMNTNYNLMSSQYGGDMSIISSYISTVRSGGKLNTDAFKSDYDRFLTQIDSYWQGKKKILFIKIPKEWFKGSTDGVRYVEDDPYILYTDALEYAAAVTEETATKKEITSNVENSFDALVVVRNSYLSLKKQTEKLKAELDKDLVLNKIGEMSFEEYSEAETLYKESNMNTLDALDLYTQTLNSYDRLTCGAITKLMNGTSISLDSSSGGISNADLQNENQITYSITSKIEDSVFELSIHVPEGFQVEVTDYELWVDDTQIGSRVSNDQKIRHLTLALDSTQKVYIRLMNKDTVVADCIIDPQEYQGVLVIPGISAQSEEKTTKKVASYSYTTNKTTNMTELTVKPDMTEGIVYYKILGSNGSALRSEEPMSVNDTFTYLSFITASIGDLSIVFYDAEKNEKYTGKFQPVDMTIIVEQ